MPWSSMQLERSARCRSLQSGRPSSSNKAMNDAQVIVAAVAFRRSPAGRRRFQSRVRVGPAVRRSAWLSPPPPGPTRHCHSKITASCTGPGPGRHWLRRRALGTPSPLCRRRAVETLRRLAWENGKCRWIASPCAMPSMACVPIRQNPKLPSSRRRRGGMEASQNSHWIRRSP